MINKTVYLNNPIPITFKEELSNKLYYLSEHIKEFVIQCDDEYIRSINFYCDHDIDLNVYLQELLRSDFSDRKQHESKMMWQSTMRHADFIDAFEALIQAGHIHINGDGFVTLGGPLLRLYNYIDGRIRDFCCNSLGAQEYLYPTMVRTEVVEKCGFLANSSHLLYFITHLKRDLSNYQSFIEGFKDTGHIKNDPQYFSNDRTHCLPPTICYHTYDQLEGSTIEQNLVITAKGNAFRNESQYAKKLERLCGFTIRETVFFGDYQFVNSTRKKILSFLQSLVDEFQLVGHMESANDPFFMDENVEHKIVFQKALYAKIELRILHSPANSVAVGSFNYHDKFFTSRFQIKSKKTDHLVSGCTGFGLERFVYAFVCQHGLDVDRWPIKI